MSFWPIAAAAARGLLRRKKPPPAALVAMRLSDMVRVHPRQDESRVCSQCGERVGIYPSGQAAIAAYPGIVILCAVCADADQRPGVEPAAPIDQIRQEMRESREVEK